MEHLDALVIGAGFSGLYQLHLLRDKLRLKTRVLEAGSGVGGTWFWNRYPGARCDSESVAYNYVFSKELYDEWDWSERYPGHAEIRRYLNFVADRLDLKRDITFDTRVTACTYDEAANLWRVTTETGQKYAAHYLITAVGCLSNANIPNIPGRETFKGRSVHTGNWPHEDVDFTGKRVGVIGTGSTAIQAIPVIAETAKHLTVFQRTANYSVPARNAPLTPEFKAHTKANFAEIKRLLQTTANGMNFEINPVGALEVGADERQKAYEKAWEVGGLRFRAAFRDIPLDKAANETASSFIKSKIRAILKNPETADVLADIDHPYAGKRPPIDTDYFETYNRDNVTLVDLRKGPIEAITPTGIQTARAHYDLDMIVYATGFDAMTGPLFRLDISGRDGVALKDVWKSGPQTYLGLQVVGFPNLFTVTGPGSPSVLTNMPTAIEQHVEWIANCIADMRANGFTKIEPKSDAVAQWGEDVQAAANMTLLPTVKHSWYLGANIPGKPRVFMPYAGGMHRYRQICAEIAADGYRGFVRG
jgi:cation diffusion facilitator CzcD-associated flavoprotein CzcO